MTIAANGQNIKTGMEYDKRWLIENSKQPCPNCGKLIGNIKGSREAICLSCGFKDPCCE